MAWVPQDATAFAHRDRPYMFSIITEWDDPAEIEQHRAWTQATWRKLEPYGNGVYVNFLEDEGKKRTPGVPASNLCAPGRSQAPVRSDQSLSAKSKHPTPGLESLCAPTVRTGLSHRRRTPRSPQSSAVASFLKAVNKSW
jgi:hypothetical protein